jgi:hypothetical protein
LLCAKELQHSSTETTLMFGMSSIKPKGQKWQIKVSNTLGKVLNPKFKLVGAFPSNSVGSNVIHVACLDVGLMKGSPFLWWYPQEQLIYCLVLWIGFLGYAFLTTLGTLWKNQKMLDVLCGDRDSVFTSNGSTKYYHAFDAIYNAYNVWWATASDVVTLKFSLYSLNAYGSKLQNTSQLDRISNKKYSVTNEKNVLKSNCKCQ